MSENRPFTPRTYPVGLTANKIRLIAEALSLFYVAVEDEIDAEDVSELHQFFDNLQATVAELEPISYDRK